MRRFLAFAVITGLAMTARAADTGFLDKSYESPDGKTFQYVLFVPHDYKKGTPTPTILFLHGAGETKPKEGSQPKGKPKMPVEVGIGTAIKKREKSFPFITIIPQAPVRGWQAGGDSAKMALGILADVEKNYSVDPKRTYLTGLSMGGFGTWSLAAAMPDKWAAIVPICGGVRGNSQKEVAEKIKDIPTWVFHGGSDPTVPVTQSKDMVAALEKAGGHPKYTEYPGVGHNSWDKAYDTDDLYKWLLEQKKK
jgi:predicted peptidase